MKKLANIVTTYPKENFGDLFNVVRECRDAEEGIPTLIIGLDNAKKCVDGFNILVKRYEGGMLWWTFKKNERRVEYDSDISEFMDYALKRFADSVTFSNVNPISLTKAGVKRCLSFIKNKDRKYCFFTKDKNYVFVYWKKNKKVIGFSLSTCEYCGFDKERIAGIIKSNKSNWMVGMGDFVGSDIRGVIGTRTHLIPALYEYFQSK